jgi:signal transduction histidine kinase
VLAELGRGLAVLGTAAVVVILPGLLVAALFAIRAARTIGRPVDDLAAAAGALAEGHLDRRVAIAGEDELASLGRSFNEMAERLEASVAAHSVERRRAEDILDKNRQLVASVSHELRTPVALIRGHLDAAAETAGNADAHLRIALHETDRLEHLIDDLFALSSTEAGALRFELQPHDLSSAAQEAVEGLAEVAWREAQVTVALEAPAPVICCVDRPRLVQVVQNLVRNGVRHTLEGGLVAVRVRGHGSEAVVEVADTGGGIAPEELPHVFERFYRGDPSRTRASGGAGLGLAIVKEFVEAMGGTVAVASEPGHGATFSVRFPLAEETTLSAGGHALHASPEPES